MRIWGNKASVYLDGKWSPFMPYNEAVKLQVEHTAKQIEAAIARGKPVLMTRDQAQHLDAARARNMLSKRQRGKRITHRTYGENGSTSPTPKTGETI